METHEVDRLVEALRASKVMAKLESMARELAGVVLVVYVRQGDQIRELFGSGRPAVLPAFCTIVRGSSAGRKRCAACRQLIAFGASYRGSNEFCCHGGVSVVAASGQSAGYDPDDSVVVASCAFSHADSKSGWRAARSHARDLPLDLAQLRRSYRELPALTEEKVGLVNAIVDTAAAAVDEIRGRLSEPRAGKDRASDRRDGPAFEAAIGSALRLSRDKGFRRSGDPAGADLVSLVMAMVGRDPGLPFSVANIARAARITPNYFSMLFRKHAGRTFVAFLTEQRIELAKTCLLDARLSVAEVADRAGFGDPGYFARRFRKATGRTPNGWREQPGKKR
ncbi:MAG: helix-turn-helix domain-containing protein [Kiritimatiellae bacterium]|nr:helix-turn-helix domain-containing protein [Kiritimatiellia bacterium]